MSEEYPWKPQDIPTMILTIRKGKASLSDPLRSRGNKQQIRYMVRGLEEILLEHCERITTAADLGTDAERAARLRAVGLCPCSAEIDEPGAHIPTCPFSDPDYNP